LLGTKFCMSFFSGENYGRYMLLVQALGRFILYHRTSSSATNVVYFQKKNLISYPANSWMRSAHMSLEVVKPWKPIPVCFGMLTHANRAVESPSFLCFESVWRLRSFFYRKPGIGYVGMVRLNGRVWSLTCILKLERWTKVRGQKLQVICGAWDPCKAASAAS